jgi:hypothetical protein
VIVTVWVRPSVPAASTPAITTSALTGPTGVPETIPSGPSDNPSGSVPEARDHATGPRAFEATTAMRNRTCGRPRTEGDAKTESSPVPGTEFGSASGGMPPWERDPMVPVASIRK